MRKITVALGTSTTAMKAKRLLRAEGVQLSVTKLSSTTENGCQYGIVIAERDLLTSAAVLRRTDISYTVNSR